MPDKPGPRTGSTTPTPLIVRREHWLQGSLTEGQHFPSGPHDAMGEGVNGRHLSCCNGGLPCTPLHYASERDRTALPGLGKAPLTERAVLQAGATQGGREVALRISSIGTGG